MLINHRAGTGFPTEQHHQFLFNHAATVSSVMKKKKHGDGFERKSTIEQEC
jgi:hypothetical protein